ncbi:MAG: heme ABC transporter permease CcmB [Dehalococcoidia bacterium]|nr:MAG: heme ABC transporter permease CcmB [Dehalococcoidia bacterium]
MTFWRKVFAITWKDVLSEFRAREIITSVLVFTILVIIIFNFAFGERVEMVAVAPGMLWVTFTFAGVLSLNRSFILEKEDGCFEGLLVSPASRDVIYTGKMLASLVFLLVIEAIALPVFAFLFNLTVLTPEITAITLLATIGFVACGTLFSALATNTKARELVLPILFLPVVVPVIIGAVNASELALSGKSWGDMTGWLGILAAFDVVFLTVAYLVFDYVIEE